jgi:D-sedoheptulose 7-phosphate isomerase
MIESSHRAAKVHTTPVDYANRLAEALVSQDWSVVTELSNDLAAARREKRQVFICGNGGSAATAIHWANDLLYGVNKLGHGMLRVHALPANSSVLTCLANDISYAEVFSTQLQALANAGDILVVISGSGNSPNVIRALEEARHLGLKSYALLGFNGGQCKELADVPIHFPIDDMQLVEDLHMIVGHMLMKSLCQCP